MQVKRGEKETCRREGGEGKGSEGTYEEEANCEGKRGVRKST